MKTAKKLLLCFIFVNCAAITLCDLPQCFKLKFGEISCNEAVGVNTIIKTIPAKNECLSKKTGSQLFQQLDGLKKLIKNQGVDSKFCRKLEGKMKSQSETMSKQEIRIEDLKKTNSKLVKEFKKCKDTQGASKDICLLPKKVGHCRAAQRWWYYDAILKNCKIFHYGGCGGNANKFKRWHDCEQQCGHRIRKSDYRESKEYRKTQGILRGI